MGFGRIAFNNLYKHYRANCGKQDNGELTYLKVI